MVAMKRGPIGVWFSIAIVIFLLSLWLGSMFGSAIARYRYGHYPLNPSTFSASERARLQSELTDLATAQALCALTLITSGEKKPTVKYLLDEIAGLEDLKRRTTAQEIKPQIDLALGLAYVDAATVEEQNNATDLAKRNMQSAQVLFESLGWKDYSEGTLKAMAERGILKWKPPLTRAISK